MAYSGMFRPRNTTTYKGDSTKIKYRSLLERRVMVWLDECPRVLEWQSELIIIKYVSPKDNKVHRYFTDFSVVYLNAKGVQEKYIIEVKPKIQCKPPIKKSTKTGKSTRRYLKESMTYAINDSKWKYARAWCLENGYTFQLWTEEIIDRVTGVSTRKITPKKH